MVFMDWVVSKFKCPLSMFCSKLSLEEAPELSCLQIREVPPVVFIFLYVVHKIKILDTTVSGIKKS